MRVNILGGGPAGLYLAILLKKKNPSHRVRVVERNAPDDTFGWGVVFSDETMSNLEEADAETYRQITGEFCRWTDIDIFVEDAHVRSTGHGFCGIARKRLLQILQERARGLGVELTFKEELADVDSYRKDCDLLVGSDGLRSVVRKRYEDVFKPMLDVRKARYIWLGTKRRWETFTFSFRKNEHGLFQIHAYPFDATHGTMIVETDEKTYRAAGLDKMSEAESVAYCEKVFQKELRGEKCLPNRSTWIQFTTVKNERWWHENVVILGDAAHTAHFSIGSGTKIALEDAISLAGQLHRAVEEKRSVESALAGYEEERKPVVGRIQTAAQQSLEWFENAPRYYDAFVTRSNEPLQLAVSLLTRSRRITHANLKLRDPVLVEQADQRFAHTDAAPMATGRRTPPPMFTPFRLRELELQNRVVVSSMCQYSATDGLADDWHLVHLGSRAVGGAGLVMAEMTDVLREGRITEGCTGLYEGAQVAAWKRVVDFVHGNSKAAIGIQLAHAGRKGSTGLPWDGEPPLTGKAAWETLGPSPLAYDAEKGFPPPREMNRADMIAVRDAFVAATGRALGAGFDLVELHMAHGYLLSSFLTPLSNQRHDEYGGSLDNRLRFPLEVFDAVRESWPKQKPLGVRISATDWVEGAFTDADAAYVSAQLKAHGCDFIDVSAGQTSPLSKPVYGRMFQTPFSDKIRNEVGIATIAVGNIQDFDQINTIVLSGRADLCALARPHLVDPYFTLHAAVAQGWADQIPWPKQYLAARPR